MSDYSDRWAPRRKAAEADRAESELLRTADAALEAVGGRVEFLEDVLRSMDVAGPSQPPSWYVDKARAAIRAGTTGQEGT